MTMILEILNARLNNRLHRNKPDLRFQQSWQNKNLLLEVVTHVSVEMLLRRPTCVAVFLLKSVAGGQLRFLDDKRASSQ